MAISNTFVDKLCTIFVDLKIFTPEQVEELKRDFEQSSQQQFDYFLLKQGLISEEDMLRALSEYYQVPSFDCSGYFFKRDLLRKFPQEFLLRNLIIPVEVDENIMIMVANNPQASDLLNKIGQYVSYDIQFRVDNSEDIVDAIQEYYDKSPTQPEIEEDKVLW